MVVLDVALLSGVLGLRRHAMIVARYHAQLPTRRSVAGDQRWRW